MTDEEQGIFDRAARLRTVRYECGYMSATKAADALAVPIGTYLGHENGNRDMSPATVERYARFFDVRPAWIMFGELQKKAGSLINAPAKDDGLLRAGDLVEALDNAPFIDKGRTYVVHEVTLTIKSKNPNTRAMVSGLSLSLFKRVRP